MIKDISTQYNRMNNKENGRRGYGMWKQEKDSVIAPKNYGMFLQKRRCKSYVK